MEIKGQPLLYWGILAFIVGSIVFGGISFAKEDFWSFGGSEVSASPIQSDLTVPIVPTYEQPSIVPTPSLMEPGTLATMSPTPEPPIVVETIATTVPTTLPTSEQTVVVQTTEVTVVPTTAKVTTVPTTPTTIPTTVQATKAPTTVTTPKPSADVRIVGEKTIPEGPYYIHMVEVTSSTGFKGVIGTTFSYNEMGADMPLGVELEPGQTAWFEYRRGTVADRVPVDLGLKITYIKG